MSDLLARLSPVLPEAAPGPVRELLLEHFYRGARIQRVLRVALIAFFAGTLFVIPPGEGQALSWVIVLCYLVWAVVVGLLVSQATEEVAPYVWLALIFDVLATSSLTVVADASAQQSWTAYVIVNGFFLLPVLAAAQLSPSACGVVSTLAVVTYLVSSAATHHDGTEMWSALVLRTALLAVLGLGCVLLSAVQRQRLLAITALATDRSRLVAELVDVEERERQALAEHLHDGALQYILAARHDVEDVTTDPLAAERVDHALGEAIRMMRSTLTQLHPVVLQEVGLLPALRELTAEVGRRLDVRLVVEDWADLPTSVDQLLLGTARELLTNVVKHAGASSAVVELSQEVLLDKRRFARLVVADDGRGLSPDDLDDLLRAGHLGIASRRIHVEAAGGRLDIRTALPHGTRVEVVLPLPD